jgi:hypothetical protein
MTVSAKTKEHKQNNELTKKDPLARALIDEIFVRNSKNLHNARELLLFILPRENREPCV